MFSKEKKPIIILSKLKGGGLCMGMCMDEVRMINE